ncbi:MAG TPA: DUF3106 domain-containing protein [Rhodanobacteraceae bacterium]|nr:DUF3106 domain-containing protein [Rhodanobacteraceae bacterium]
MRRSAMLAMFLAAACLFGMPCAASAQTATPMQGTSAGSDTPGQPIAWSSLSSAQQRMLAPLQGQWDQMKPGRQHHLAQNAERWATLPPEHQQQIRERLTRWAAMTPEERRQLRENARAFHDLTPEERAKVSAAFRRFQSLPPAERRALRERWRAMPPQQRMHWAVEHADQPNPMHPPAHSGH